MRPAREDLLAVYLRRLNTQGEHDFNIPDNRVGLEVEPAWDRFSKHPQRFAQLAPDKHSYEWDAIIERLTKHIVDRTAYHATSQVLGDNDKALRLLARERFRRRVLRMSQP